MYKDRNEDKYSERVRKLYWSFDKEKYEVKQYEESINSYSRVLIDKETKEIIHSWSNNQDIIGSYYKNT